MITARSCFRALIVEDDALIRQATMRAMAQHGFSCDAAADGLYALSLLKDATYDVIIADLRMPEMNGHEMIVRVLKSESRPAIIVHTGVPDPRLVRDLFIRGVDDVVTKPANFDVLVLKAEALVERRRAAKATVGATAAQVESLEPKVATEIIDSEPPPTPAPAEPEVEIKSVQLDLLIVGQLLAEDIVDNQGRLLVKSDTTVSQTLKDQLVKLAQSVGIREPLSVWAQKNTEP